MWPVSCVLEQNCCSCDCFLLPKNVHLLVFKRVTQSEPGCEECGPYTSNSSFVSMLCLAVVYLYKCLVRFHCYIYYVVNRSDDVKQSYNNFRKCNTNIYSLNSFHKLQFNKLNIKNICVAFYRVSIATKNRKTIVARSVNKKCASSNTISARKHCLAPFLNECDTRWVRYFSVSLSYHFEMLFFANYFNDYPYNPTFLSSADCFRWQEVGGRGRWDERCAPSGIKRKRTSRISFAPLLIPLHLDASPPAVRETTPWFRKRVWSNYSRSSFHENPCESASRHPVIRSVKVSLITSIRRYPASIFQPHLRTQFLWVSISVNTRLSVY